MDFHLVVDDAVRKWISKSEGKREELERTIKLKDKRIENNEELLTKLEKAKWILAEVSKLRQRRFKEFLEKMVTSAWRAVYDRELAFKLDYQIKARRTQAVPLVLENGHEQDPELDVGIGSLDIASYAWRIVTLFFERPRPRMFLWLDEPMRHIGHGKLLDRAGRMIKELAAKKKVQLIINTHESELASIADRTFTVEHNGRFSVVTQDGRRRRGKLI